MTVQSALDSEAHALLREIGHADIVVGIPSFRNAQTVGHVAGVAAQGLAKHFAGAKALLMNSDGGSPDGTREAFRNAPEPGGVQKLAIQYRGKPGKGTALKAIFEASAMLGADACVVVDSDLRSITPDWIRLLGEPVVSEGAGYVTPLYLRHKYDGTITNSLAYPLTRALYGKRVRQPIGGDFGLSGALAKSYLEKNVWEGPAAQFGIDIFMTTTAVNEGFELRQANLGAKIHDAKDPAADLGPMFRQVVGTMFSLMQAYEDSWLTVRRSEPVKTVGPALAQEPDPVSVTLPALVQKFKEGFEIRGPIFADILSADTLAQLKRLAGLDADRFVFPATLWVRTVYEFAVAFNTEGSHPDEIVDSLTPLYFGRTAGFVRETDTLTSAEAERILEEVAELYEEEKPYLVELWRRK